MHGRVFSPYALLLISANSRKRSVTGVRFALTFNLGVQVIDYDLELAQRHVSQVGGLQASLH